MTNSNIQPLTKEEKAAKRQARIERRVGQVLDKQDTAALVFALTNLYNSINSPDATPAHYGAYDMVGRQLEARHPEMVALIDKWYAEIGETNVARNALDVYVAALTELGLLDSAQTNIRPTKES